ncbi:MAG: hypothetical protein WC997_13040 [Porticoccaceae bacterium]
MTTDNAGRLATGVCHEQRGPVGQGGMVLIEALVAFLVLALGIVALLGFHGAVQVSVAEARTRAEAMALAEEKIQILRNGGEDFSAGNGCDAVAGQTLRFERCWQLTGGALPALHHAAVTVSWHDRAGTVQQAALVSAASPGAAVASMNALFTWVTDVAISPDDINSWLPPAGSSAEPPGEEGGDGDDDPEDEGDDENGGDDEAPDVTLKSVRIAGRLSSGSPANAVLLSVVTESAQYGECVIESDARAFSCRVSFNELSSGWSGNVMLRSNAVLCGVDNSKAVPTVGPGSVSLAYSNLTGNDSAIVISAAQYPDDC